MLKGTQTHAGDGLHPAGRPARVQAVQSGKNTGLPSQEREKAMKIGAFTYLYALERQPRFVKEPESYKGKPLKEWTEEDYAKFDAARLEALAPQK